MGVNGTAKEVGRIGRLPAWLVVVGCSWGGMEALRQFLADLPRESDCVVVVVQHRRQTDSALASLLGARSPWPVLEPDDKEPLLAGRVYLAPAGYHLMVENDHLALSTEGPFNFSRPSVDVLFESAASAWGARTVAVVLTGANSDGAHGAARVVAAGGHLVVQDPFEAERGEMPRAALSAVPSAEVLALTSIGARVGKLTSGDAGPGPGQG